MAHTIKLSRKTCRSYPLHAYTTTFWHKKKILNQKTSRITGPQHIAPPLIVPFSSSGEKKNSTELIAISTMRRHDLLTCVFFHAVKMPNYEVVTISFSSLLHLVQGRPRAFLHSFGDLFTTVTLLYLPFNNSSYSSEEVVNHYYNYWQASQAVAADG